MKWSLRDACAYILACTRASVPYSWCATSSGHRDAVLLSALELSFYPLPMSCYPPGYGSDQDLLVSIARSFAGDAPSDMLCVSTPAGARQICLV